jgi:putative membrane protein
MLIPLAEAEGGGSGYTGLMSILLKYLGTVAAVFLTIYLVPGLASTGGWTTILLVALIWSVITMVIRPVLKILTLPITLITFGLFSFVLNALLFWAMELIVPGFVVQNFIAAFLGAIVLSILTWLIHKVL